MNKIAAFIADVGDEDKLLVVDGIIALSSKYPAKYHTIMNYLSMMLRGEGGKDYKSTIIDGILGIMENVKDSKESGKSIIRFFASCFCFCFCFCFFLSFFFFLYFSFVCFCYVFPFRLTSSSDVPGLDYLCEYIEDCEFPSLLTRVLSLIGEEGPHMKAPGKYIRFIYNRIVLEGEVVRAAAVSTLAKFGLRCESLRAKVIALLRRSINDSDDEVRDRATFYVHMLDSLEDADKIIVSTLGMLYSLLLFSSCFFISFFRDFNSQACR
jgi:coatomer protein complex subunit gamma